MTAGSWEARMAARARERGADGVRRPDGSAYETYADGHEGHTTHVCYPSIRCSCGEVFGAVCFVYTGNEVEVPCEVCGELRLTNPGGPE